MEKEEIILRSLCRRKKLYVEDYKGNILEIENIVTFGKNKVKYQLIPDWDTEIYDLEHDIEVLQKELDEKKEKLNYLKNG